MNITHIAIIKITYIDDIEDSSHLFIWNVYYFSVCQLIIVILYH